MSKPRFTLDVKIHRITHIPMSGGTVHVKWYIKDSAKPDARGRTEMATIADHKAEWNHTAETKVKIGVGHDGFLKRTPIIFDVYWDKVGSSRINMGRVEINIAEHVGRDQDRNRTERDPVMRVLLKDSRVNSVLHVEICATQYKGNTEYRVPDITTPQLFGDITGVIDEQRTRLREQETNHRNHLDEPLAISKLYHRTFAVVWDTRPGDLDPEACIEDIFAGGDGFNHEYEGMLPQGLRTPSSSQGAQRTQSHNSSSSYNSSRTGHSSRQHQHQHQVQPPQHQQQQQQQQQHLHQFHANHNPHLQHSSSAHRRGPSTNSSRHVKIPSIVSTPPDGRPISQRSGSSGSAISGVSAPHSGSARHDVWTTASTSTSQLSTGSIESEFAHAPEADDSALIREQDGREDFRTWRVSQL